MNELKKIRRSAIIAAIIISVIATLHLRKGHTTISSVLYILSGIFFIMGGFFPAVFRKITHAVGESITKLLLCVIYYIAFTPMALIMRLFRRDPLCRKIERMRDSYWIEKEVDDEGVTRYEKQF